MFNSNCGEHLAKPPLCVRDCSLLCKHKVSAQPIDVVTGSGIKNPTPPRDPIHRRCMSCQTLDFVANLVCSTQAGACDEVNNHAMENSLFAPLGARWIHARMR